MAGRRNWQSTRGRLWRFSRRFCWDQVKVGQRKKAENRTRRKGKLWSINWNASNRKAWVQN